MRCRLLTVLHGARADLAGVVRADDARRDHPQLVGLDLRIAGFMLRGISGHFAALSTLRGQNYQ